MTHELNSINKKILIKSAQNLEKKQYEESINNKDLNEDDPEIQSLVIDVKECASENQMTQQILIKKDTLLKNCLEKFMFCEGRIREIIHDMKPKDRENVDLSYLLILPWDNTQCNYTIFNCVS